tara:strand:- start:3905 stop:5263 length:1359 start_codon:yes stop_codon:yes gene_type:complete
MATATFKLRNNTTENSTIYVYLTVRRGKQFLKSTGLIINPKNWNSKTKSLTGFPKNINDASIKNLKSALNKLETHLLKEVNNANINGTVINSNWVEKQINNCYDRLTKEDELKEIDLKEQNKLTYQIQSFIDNSDTYIHTNNTVGLSANRVKGLKTFKNTILNFEKDTRTTVLLKNIDYIFEKNLNKWLLETKNYSSNYSGKVVDNLKTICKYSELSKVEVNAHYKLIKGYKQKNSERIIQTLSFDELDAIENWQTDKDRLDNARKWIIFGCSIGQRGSDLLNITLKNFVTIDNIKFIELTQGKTKKEVFIPINEQCKRVLSNGLPYKISVQKLNEYIKEVCELVGIKEIVKGDLYDKETKRKVRGNYPKHKVITSHCFRRSYASNYYINIETPILMEVTGHSKESTFLSYINKPKDKTRNANLMLEKMKQMEKERLEKQETPIIDLKNVNQ